MRAVLCTALPVAPAYFLGFYTFTFLLKRRPALRYRLLFFLYCFILLTLKAVTDFYWQITNTGQLYSYIVGFLLVLTLPVMLLLCFQEDWRRRLIVIFPFVCIQSAIIAPFYLFHVNQSWPMPIGRQLQLSALFYAGDLISCSVAALLVRQIIRLAERLPPTVYTILAILSPLLNLLFNLEQLFTLLRAESRLQGIWKHAAYLMGEGCVLVLLFLWLLYRQTRQEVAIAAAQEQMHQSALQAQQDNLTLLRTMRQQHRQGLEQIGVLLEQQRPEEALAAVRAMTCCEAPAARRYADNPVADVSLADAARRCTEAGVRLTIHGTLPKNCTLPPVDLASLLYNLFSNAVTAAAQAPDPARVDIVFLTAAGRLCVTVRNSVAPGPLRRSSGDGHGFGRKILQEITARYDGSYTLQIRDGEAVATAMVCLPDNREETAHDEFL